MILSIFLTSSPCFAILFVLRAVFSWQNYPGVFKKIYIVNYPVGIYALWKIVSPLLDQDTINAIVFVKSPLKLREELAGDMPDELMPDFLGGGGKTMEMQSNRMELANGVELSVAEVSQRLQ